MGISFDNRSGLSKATFELILAPLQDLNKCNDPLKSMEYQCTTIKDSTLANLNLCSLPTCSVDTSEKWAAVCLTVTMVTTHPALPVV